MGMRRRRLSVAVAVLGLALSPATLWAQEGGEPEPPVEPPDPAEVEPDPAPPPPEENPSTPPPPDPPPEPGPGQVPPDPPDGTPAPEPRATPVLRQSGASVSIIDFAFQPSAIQVTVGGSVTWTNNGAEAHTASSDTFDTGEIGVGSSASVPFDQEGSVSYFCSIHPEMTGTVTVVGTTEEPPPDGDDGTDGTDDDGSVPGPTEAAAVASPDAAGTDGSLPATGAETGLLAAVGLMLLAVGAQLLAAQRLRRWLR